MAGSVNKVILVGNLGPSRLALLNREEELRDRARQGLRDPGPGTAGGKGAPRVPPPADPTVTLSGPEAEYLREHLALLHEWSERGWTRISDDSGDSDRSEATAARGALRSLTDE